MERGVSKVIFEDLLWRRTVSEGNFIEFTCMVPDQALQNKEMVTNMSYLNTNSYFTQIRNKYLNAQKADVALDISGGVHTNRDIFWDDLIEWDKQRYERYLELGLDKLEGSEYTFEYVIPQHEGYPDWSKFDVKAANNNDYYISRLDIPYQTWNPTYILDYDDICRDGLSITRLSNGKATLVYTDIFNVRHTDEIKQNGYVAIQAKYGSRIKIQGDIKNITISGFSLKVKGLVMNFENLQTVTIQNNAIVDQTVKLPSKVKKLTSINLNFNTLSKIDVSHNPNLIDIALQSCGLKEIDITKNTKLTSVNFHGLKTTEPINLLNQPELTTIGASSSHHDMSLWCDMPKLNQIYIDSSTVVLPFEPNRYPTITYLGCGSCKLPSLDVSKLTKVTTLRCSGNPIGSIDLTNNTKVTTLELSTCQLTELNLSAQAVMKLIRCYGNSISNLDFSHNPLLETVYAYSNNATSIDVSQNAKLAYLSVYSNKFTSLDLSGNPVLSFLDCHSNSTLTDINVSSNPLLVTLYCHTCNLSTLDVSHNPELEFLTCHGNPLTTLDVSHNPKLKKLILPFAMYDTREDLNLTESQKAATKFYGASNFTTSDGKVFTKAKYYDYNGDLTTA